VGLIYKTGIIMKNAYKSFALLCMGLAAVACVGEQLEDDKPKYEVIPGNEISFSANAKVENGTPQTKTEYGGLLDTNNDNKYDAIEIKWNHGDPIQIASPHTAGTTSAKYLVNLGEGATENTAAAEAVSLDRQGGVGLQWTERTKPYSFYAMYPSPDTFGDDENTLVIVDKEGETVTMKGHLPVDMLYDEVPAIDNDKYMISPDMRYAYMVANDTYDKGNSDDDIALNFTSLTTALQFEIQAGDIIADSQSKKEIIISQIQLFSADAKKLSGDFTYSFKEEVCSEGTSSYVSVSFNISNGDNKPSGLVLGVNQYCDFTCFILPSYQWKENDLKLKVAYYYDGVLQTKTATIGTMIKARKKHYFKGVRLPDVKDMTPSNWFDALDPATPVAKLSLPVAGNAYSYAYDEQSDDTEKFYKQQLLSPSQLWNMGVRGFELKTSYGSTVTSNNSTVFNIGDEHFVCNGTELSGAGTFDSAFKELYGLLQDNPTETLVIIATYQSYSSDNTYGVNAQNFITSIENYLSSVKDREGKDIPKSQFAKLTTASTVGEIQGKVVLIIRPGDNDLYNNYGVSTSYAVSEDWEDYIALIPNWGTGADQWDKRFGSTYYTEGAFTYSNSGKTSFESKYLNGSTGELTGPTESWPSTRNPYWVASVNGDSNQPAYIQCWERVVPNNDSWNTTGVSERFLFWGGDTVDLYYYWPESYSEKVSAITRTIQASRNSINEGGNPGLYINSLSGYFMTESLEGSIRPFVTEERIDNTNYTVDFDNGGDNASCAANLNYLLWNELQNPENPDTAYGPLGVVILDYIGAESSLFSSFLSKVSGLTAIEASNACKALPGLILMNYFKVKPSTGGGSGSGSGGTNGGTTDPQPTSYDARYVDGGEAISFE